LTGLRRRRKFVEPEPMSRKACRHRRYDTGADEPKGLLEPVSFLLRSFPRTPVRIPSAQKEVHMGLLDKLLGRGKKTAGDVLGDASMRREGMHQEQEGRAEDRAAKHEELAQEERTRAAEHHVERDTP
jgi:uncharacterized protein YjbJ (UPF0337 family)